MVRWIDADRLKSIILQYVQTDKEKSKDFNNAINIAIFELNRQIDIYDVENIVDELKRNATCGVNDCYGDCSGCNEKRVDLDDAIRIVTNGKV